MQGWHVVVVEAGGATSRRNYTQLESVSNPRMMYRGGNAYTADRNVALLAGATLGGGTTINWQNCVLPSDKMRREWATEHGLTGLDTEEFDLHLSAVLLRMGANDRCSDFNGPHQRMAEGARALGWSLRTAVRNVDEETYDPALAGYTQFGDPSGSKRGTLSTYLEDAFDHGARAATRLRAGRCDRSGVVGAARQWHRQPPHAVRPLDPQAEPRIALQVSGVLVAQVQPAPTGASDSRTATPRREPVTAARRPTWWQHGKTH